MDSGFGFDVCECDPLADTCDDGFYCSDQTFRCTAEYRALEWTDCTGLEGYSLVSGLYCHDFGTVTFWIRVCTTSADCLTPGFFCPFESDPTLLNACIPNRCGPNDSEISAIFPQNGDYFGSCDAQYHGALPGGAAGTCQPAVVAPLLGTCLQDGTSTTTCRSRDPRGFVASTKCAPGYVCREDLSGWSAPCATDLDCPHPSLYCKTNVSVCQPRPCYTDAECGAGGYCGSDGLCLPEGECQEACNAGSFGSGVGPQAGCGAGLTCHPHPDNQLPLSDPIVPGLCQ